MQERDKTLSLRGFLKIGLAGAGAVGLIAVGRKVEKYISPLIQNPDLDFLEGVSPNKNFPKELVGVGLNGPFIWTRERNKVREFFNFAEMTETEIFRIMPENADNELETTLGKLNTKIIDKIGNFLNDVPKNTKVIIPIIDGYRIFHCDKWNPAYEPEDPTSPYLTDKSSKEKIYESRRNFFTDEECRDAYKKRADTFIELSKNYPNIILELGNEVSSPAPGKAGVKENTLWYEEMYDYVAQSYKGLILTGLPDPNRIDTKYFADKKQLVHTYHIYPGSIVGKLPDAPAIIEEIGFPSQLVGLDIPLADKFLRNIILNTVKASVQFKIARIGGVFVWQADKLHKDSLNFNEDEYPQTTAMLQGLSPKLKEVFAA